MAKNLVKGNKSSIKNKTAKPFQISKEYFKGQWQMVAFNKRKNGEITIKLVEKNASKSHKEEKMTVTFLPITE